MPKKEKDTAAQLLESFIEDGFYPEMKQAEAKVKKLTNSIREQLEDSESKRHEFKDCNLVGRFIAKKVYETDTIALNEYLYDIGLLLHVVEIDNKTIQSNGLYFDMIQDFKLEDTFYPKLSLNKIGKEFSKVPDSFVISDWKIEDKARHISILKPRLKELSRLYDKLKRNLMKEPQIVKLMSLPKEKRKPLSHKFGSLSIVPNQAKYDISSIYDYIGEWMLIEYGKPNSSLLEPYILNGTITPKDIEQFKKVTDIRLDFSIMNIEDEKRLFDMLDTKNKIIAANRMGA